MTNFFSHLLRPRKTPRRIGPLPTPSRTALRLALATSVLSALSAPPFALADPLANPETGAQDWTGFYLGGSLGARHQNLRWTALGTGYLNWDGIEPFDAKETVADFGLYLGRSAPLGDRFVWGWELGWAKAASAVNYSGGPAAYKGTWTSELDTLVTLTGRVGREMGAFLPYLELGIAGGNVRATADLSSGCGGPCTTQDAGWIPGIVAGIGADYRLSDRLSLGVTYRYITFPQQRTSMDLPLGPVTSHEAFHLEGHSNQIAARLTYYFN